MHPCFIRSFRRLVLSEFKGYSRKGWSGSEPRREKGVEEEGAAEGTSSGWNHQGVVRDVDRLGGGGETC